MLTFQELLKKYEVTCTYSSVDSNVVYPFDGGEGYQRIGEVSEEFVNLWINQMKPFLRKPIAGQPNISNKYALPIFQTETLKAVVTWFLYQHDDRVYLISKLT